MKLMPGCVGVIVTSTVVCASRLESVCDCAMIWIGYVPLWRPGAGVAVTLPLAVDRDRPAGRGVGREVVGVGEAGLDVRPRT